MTTSQDEIELGAYRIRNGFVGADPFFVGRNGTIELQILSFWSQVRRHGAEYSYPPSLTDTIERHAGVWPATDQILDAWCSAYVVALKELDGLAAGWYKPLANAEASLLTEFCPSAFRCPLRSLEPYYVDSILQWTHALKGKRVCVVSSFAESMRDQVDRGALKRVWPGGLLPADIAWSFVRTGYAPKLAGGDGPCTWPAGVQTWQAAVRLTRDRVLAEKPDVVIIGCGGLGMIIGAGLRREGCSVLVLGGATQLLFGIKGRRWETHDIISKFWNSSWVWPKASETPAGARQIEGGCYWG
jgi:hypothetical protein